MNERAEIQLSVVVPVFDEVGNLPRLHRELVEVLAEGEGRCELIYVDDRSTDGSWDVLQELAADETGVAVRCLRLRRNYGQTAALATGFAASRGAVVVALDADLQNDPRDIPALVEKLEEGFDVVSGWRRSRTDRAHRIWLSRAANWLLPKVTGVRVHDSGCTLKAYRGDVIRSLRLYGDMHRFLPIYLARTGARVAELEVAHRARASGRSKYGSRSHRIPKVLLDLVLVLFMSRYFTRPMHFFGQASLAFAGAGGLVFTAMLIFKYGWLSLVGVDYRPSFIETPLPALAATFLTSSVLALFFGILGEILVRIYYEVGDRSPYQVAERLETDA